MTPAFTDNDVNLVLGEEHVSQRDTDFLFGGEGWCSMPRNADIVSILAEFKFFPSKSEARRNWKRGEITDGWNEFLAIGKKRRNIFIWKPTEVIFQ